MKNKRSARRRAAGYSLIELVVVAAIVAVLAATALPALARLVQDNRRTAVVNALVATLVLARSETLKRQQTIVVCGFSDADHDRRLDESERRCTGRDWSAGWFAAAWVDADADGTVDPAELAAPALAQVALEEPRITVHAPAFTAGAEPPGAAVFRPMRKHASNGTFVICDERGADHARAVIVSPTGRARAASRRPGGSPLTCPLR